MQQARPWPPAAKACWPPGGRPCALCSNPRYIKVFCLQAKKWGLLIRRPPLRVIIGMNEEAHPQPVSIITSYDWIALTVGLTACLYFMAMLLWVA